MVDPRHHPYRPNFEFWSDGGAKRRWISLPDNARIDSSNGDRWIFPVGTTIWKEFSFLGRRVETRMLRKEWDEIGIDSWSVSTFHWAADESDAERVNHGRIDVAPTGLGTSHDIPTVGDCFVCHEKGDGILGFSAVQLMGEGEGLRLADLLEQDRLSTPVTPSLPDLAPERLAVYGALHTNCGICHTDQRVGAPSTGTDLMLDLKIAASSERQLPAYETAVGVLTTRYQVPGRTLGTDSFQVHPGDPLASAVYLRAANRGDFQIQMPPLGSEASDPEFLAMLSQWISAVAEDQDR